MALQQVREMHRLLRTTQDGTSPPKQVQKLPSLGNTVHLRGVRDRLHHQMPSECVGPQLSLPQPQAHTNKKETPKCGTYAMNKVFEEATTCLYDCNNRVHTLLNKMLGLHEDFKQHFAISDVNYKSAMMARLRVNLRRLHEKCKKRTSTCVCADDSACHCLCKHSSNVS